MIVACHQRYGEGRWVTCFQNAQVATTLSLWFLVILRVQ